MEAIDLGLFILRLAIGAVMIAHGLNHGRNLDSTATWFESIGFRQAKMQAFLAAAGELAIGTGLIFGFLTTFASAGLVATMVVAGVSNHRKAGFFAFNRPIEGWEYVMTLGVVIWILLQPDLSTSIVIMVIWFALIWVSGLRRERSFNSVRACTACSLSRKLLDLSSRISSAKDRPSSFPCKASP